MWAAGEQPVDGATNKAYSRVQALSRFSVELGCPTAEGRLKWLYTRSRRHMVLKALRCIARGGTP